MAERSTRSTAKKSAAKRSAAKKSAAPKKSRIVHDSQGMPRTLFAQASPRSVGLQSMFQTAPVTAETVGAVMSEPDIMVAAATQLQQAGFSVLQMSPTTINIAGPPKLYRDAFGCRLDLQDRPVIKEGGREDVGQFVECLDTDLPGLIDTAGTAFANLIEGVALEEPRYFMGASRFPPSVGYHHLDVPGDVSLGCNADKAHRSGSTGRGVHVVMTDTGHFAHPFFAARGYRVNPVVLGPGASAPDADENGHGTAESANVFALAPDCDFTMVKMSFVNSIGAFNAAVALAPHVISNSWGSDTKNPPLSAGDQALAASIATAVSNGIVVVFSAGNGHFGFPGQHPDVISAGGVYVDQTGAMQASDYSSGFASVIYPGRDVPDVSGLVGMRPRAAYIMLPVEPNDDIDQGLANGQPHPDGDETAPDDGWAAISGTSAAAPQLAGAVALVKEACPSLTPAQVRSVLKKTARDVTAGRNHPRPGMDNPATPGPDLATGHGLVDASRAVLVAKIRCLRRAKKTVTPTAAALAGAAPAELAEGLGLNDEDVEALEQIVMETGGLDL